MGLMTYEFTNQWFEQSAKPTWDQIIGVHVNPKKILEIGSYEGKSLCYLIENLGIKGSDLEIHAIDTWAGGKDIVSVLIKENFNMSDVEEKFHKNINHAIEKVKAHSKIDLHVHKGQSDIEVAKLFVNGYADYFDLIYVDGSHETFDTLVDLVLSFKCLAKDGLLIVDDYLWQSGKDGVINHDFNPKTAIDAFVNIAISKIALVQANNSQVYFFKR